MGLYKVNMFFDSSYHLFPPMEWEYRIAENVGFTITMFRFVLAFLASIPVSILFRFVPTATGALLLSILVGMNEVNCHKWSLVDECNV